jgi:glyoxylase-like metal-dependent hydrolase (beta-lactamase superfamily II)
MKLTTVNAESWKLDGGATFGLVPKTIWNKDYPADELNYVNIKNRCLLIENGDRLVIIDTGLGRKQPDKFYKFKYIFGDDSLEKGFAEAGYRFEDVTDVILTHLHDDHVGGAVRGSASAGYSLTFPNATHYVSSLQWEWAMNPNKREAGAFFKENFVPLQDAGKLKLIDGEGEHIPGIFFRIYKGHTMGQIIPVVDYNGKKLVYMADLIMSVAHLPMPFIPAFDIQPLVALKEKEDFLNEAVENGYYLYFEHDYYHEICTLLQTDRGVRHKDILTLKDFTNE